MVDIDTEYISLDIFDTLLLRKECPLDTLKRISDKRVKLELEGYPVSLNRFYKFSHNLIKRELDIECSQLDVNYEILSLIEKYKDKKFILVSDMYLTKKNIEYIFLKKGIKKFYEKIYVSSECKTSKSDDGKLFLEVIKDLGTNDITHIGDNLYSDFINACHKVVRAIHYVKTSNLVKYNQENPFWFFKNIIKNIIAPTMYLFIHDIDRIRHRYDNIMCLGSTFEFYSDILKEHLNVDISHLKTSRDLQKSIVYKYFSNEKFLSTFHSDTFVKMKCKDSYDMFSKNSKFGETITERKILLKTLKTDNEELLLNSYRDEVDFYNSIPFKKNTLYVDFGYRGSFKEILNCCSYLKEQGNDLFLSFKECNSFEFYDALSSVEVFKMDIPEKEIREPFWLVPFEIIINGDSVSKLSGNKEYTSSNKGFPELLSYTKNCIRDMMNDDINVYKLRKEVSYNILNFLLSIDCRFYRHFNWLSEHTKYRKYTFSGNGWNFVNDKGYLRIKYNEYVRKGFIFRDFYKIKTEDIDKIRIPYNGKFYSYFHYIENIVNRN